MSPAEARNVIGKLTNSNPGFKILGEVLQALKIVEQELTQCETRHLELAAKLAEKEYAVKCACEDFDAKFADMKSQHDYDVSCLDAKYADLKTAHEDKCCALVSNLGDDVSRLQSEVTSLMAQRDSMLTEVVGIEERAKVAEAKIEEWNDMRKALKLTFTEEE
jgi:hypothetical protein